MTTTNGLTLQNDINQLIRLNQKILNTLSFSQFRTKPVFCLAKTGQIIKFIAPELISISLIKIIDNFKIQMEKENNIAFSMAYFWIGFISIHPFENGNGRTGKEYIRLKLQEYGYALKHPQKLNEILITGNTKIDLKNITTFFSNNLTKRITL